MKKIGKPLALARRSKPRARDEASQDAPAREWVGGSFESPFYVTDRAEPYRAQIALWLEQPEGLIVGTQLDSFFGYGRFPHLRQRIQIDVQPGMYTIVVSMPGYETQKKEVTVEDEGVAVKNIELRKAKR